jgi:streptomycin 6-kinase
MMIDNNLSIPGYFEEKVLRTFHDKGKAWLEELPGLLEEYTGRWQLTNCRVAENLSIQFICFAQSPKYGEVVLKTGVPHLEVFTGMDALELYSGRYVCRLYEMDREKGALLLERIIPGSLLREEPDFMIRTAAATGLVQKLPIHISGNHGFPTFEEQMIKAFNRVRMENRAGEEFISMLSVAQTLHERIKLLNRPMMLLHGDLHHENILKDASGEWKVIDPQRRIGPQCLESGRYLLNEWAWFNGRENIQRMTQCIEAFAASLGETGETIASCAFLDCALAHCWSLEDGGGPETVQEALELMEYLLGLIKI